MNDVKMINDYIKENPADLITIEQTQTFNGKYFVLHGNLSPLDGIGPNELGLIDFFINAHDTEIEEIIIATNATIEGDATCHYIGQKLNQMGIKWSQLGRGVPMGAELQYLDANTIEKALTSRTSEE